MNGVSMIILAGGKSSRMGREKSDLMYRGKSFLAIQAEKAAQLGIENVVISGYRGNQQPAFPIIPDAVTERGPLGGLSTCLRTLHTPWALVLSVDAPLVPAEELRKLLAFGRQTGQPVTILQSGQQQFPLIGLYRTNLADAMEEEITLHRGSVFALLRRIGYAVYTSDADPAFFSNVNDPESYQALPGL